MGLFSGNRDWVYAQSIQGAFSKYHRWSAVALHLLLFVVPWITLNGLPAPVGI